MICCVLKTLISVRFWISAPKIVKIQLFLIFDNSVFDQIMIFGGKIQIIQVISPLQILKNNGFLA